MKEASTPISKRRRPQNVYNTTQQNIGIVNQSSSIQTYTTNIENSTNSNNEHMSIDDDRGSNVRVVVRIRPISQFEASSPNHSIAITAPNLSEVRVQRRGAFSDKIFTYDQVFNSLATQESVFRAAALPIVEEVLEGFNCTIFVYGPTGTGKTHTMEGDITNNISTKNAGIIPRCVHTIFERLQAVCNVMEGFEFSIKVSFLEIYNEDLVDLLNDDENKQLRIFEDQNGRNGMVVQGLEEVIVRSAEEVFQLLHKSSLKRHVAETDQNKNSSRSHCVFTITIHLKELAVDGEDIIKTGKLHLVDLAGSECIGRSGALNQRAKEAGKINQSLLTLGRVINALVERHGHVPYRDSKLTRLLQESLGGRSKTCIIATISPSILTIDESLSTLDYASRAKNIKNKPQINQTLSKKTYMSELTNQIAKLRRENEALRLQNGIYLPSEQYEELTLGYKNKCAELEEIKTCIMQKDIDIDALQQSILQRKNELNIIGNKYIKLNNSWYNKANKIIDIEDELNEKKDELLRITFINKNHKEIEKILFTEAKITYNTLIEILKEYSVVYKEYCNDKKVLEYIYINTIQCNEKYTVNYNKIYNGINNNIIEPVKSIGNKLKDNTTISINILQKLTKDFIIIIKKYLNNIQINTNDIKSIVNDLLNKDNDIINNVIEIFNSKCIKYIDTIDTKIKSCKDISLNTYNTNHELYENIKSYLNIQKNCMKQTADKDIDNLYKLSTYINSIINEYNIKSDNFIKNTIQITIIKLLEENTKQYKILDTFCINNQNLLINSDEFTIKNINDIQKFLLSLQIVSKKLSSTIIDEINIFIISFIQNLNDDQKIYINNIDEIIKYIENLQKNIVNSFTNILLELERLKITYDSMYKEIEERCYISPLKEQKSFINSVDNQYIKANEMRQIIKNKNSERINDLTDIQNNFQITMEKSIDEQSSIILNELNNKIENSIKINKELLYKNIDDIKNKILQYHTINNDDEENMYDLSIIKPHNLKDNYYIKQSNLYEENFEYIKNLLQTKLYNTNNDLIDRIRIYSSETDTSYKKLLSSKHDNGLLSILNNEFITKYVNNKDNLTNFINVYKTKVEKNINDTINTSINNLQNVIQPLQLNIQDTNKQLQSNINEYKENISTINEYIKTDIVNNLQDSSLLYNTTITKKTDELNEYIKVTIANIKNEIKEEEKKFCELNDEVKQTIENVYQKSHIDYNMLQTILESIVDTTTNTIKQDIFVILRKSLDEHMQYINTVLVDTVDSKMCQDIQLNLQRYVICLFVFFFLPIYFFYLLIFY